MTVQIPDDVLAFINHQEPKLKDSPDHFVGRHGEMESLQAMIDETLPPIKGWGKDRKPVEGSTEPGRMYIAAPGAGKTSIMTELKERLKDEQISVILAQPDRIRNSAAFHELILGEEPWSSREGRKEVLRAIAQGLAAGTDRVGGAGLTGLALVNGVLMKVSDLKVAQTALERWLEGEPPSTETALRLLQYGNPRGCVLIIDEAQDIAEFIDDKEQKAHMNSIIGHLGIPARRLELGITRATIILAGLSDTPTVVDNVGSQGIKPIVVAPLNRESVVRMISLAIGDGCQGDETLAEQAKDQWLEAVVDEYGDWTRQAQAGAQAVQKLLAKYGERVVTAEWGWAAVRSLGERFRDEVYGGIIRRTRAAGTEREVPREIIDAATMALIRNANRVGQGKMVAALAAVLKRIPQKGQVLEERECFARAEIYAKRMLRTGVIDRTNHLPTKAEREPEAFYCPIPSLLSHVADVQSEYHAEILEALAEVGLQHGEPSPAEERFRPTWPVASTPETGPVAAERGKFDIDEARRIVEETGSIFPVLDEVPGEKN